MKIKNIFKKTLQWLKKILKNLRTIGIWNWIGVASLTVGVIGIYLTIKETDTTTATIEILDWKGENNDFINKSESKVRIWLGSEHRDFKSIIDGAVEFSEIPAKYKNERVKVEFQPSDNFPLMYIKETTILLQTKESMKLKVYVKGLDSIRGNIKDYDTEEIIEGALIKINGQSTYSDSSGDFKMDFAPDKQEMRQTIEIYKTNYERYYINVNMRTNTYNPIPFRLQRSKNITK